jgi:hypothetical protein
VKTEPGATPASFFCIRNERGAPLTKKARLSAEDTASQL